MAKNINQEKAELAYSDAKDIDEMLGWLLAYHHEVMTRGGTGRLELQKCEDQAKKCIKALANYI